MTRMTLRQRYLDTFGRRPYDEDAMNDETWALAQQLGCPPDAVQVVDLDDWRRQDESFARETRKLVQRAKAMNARAAH